MVLVTEKFGGVLKDVFEYIRTLPRKRPLEEKHPF